MILFKPVIEIVPNVSGEVTTVDADLRKPMKKGDVVFTIDAEPFEARVNELEARLALAQVNLGRAQQLMEKHQCLCNQTKMFQQELQLNSKIP